MRILVFSKRNIKELLRDPLSYIFCLGFPLVMLAIMTVVNDSIPAQANMTIYRIDNLCMGVGVFGLSFMMLFSAMLLAKDRTSAFLTRLYASPMKAAEFIGGYYLPLMVLSAAQIFINFAASAIIAAVKGVDINAGRFLLAGISFILPSVMFIGFGLLFGTIFSDKAAPGLCSAIISAAGLLGGAWMDVENISGGLKTVCEIFPFYHSVRAARHILAGSTDKLAGDLTVTLIYMAAAVLLSITAFSHNMTKDSR